MTKLEIRVRDYLGPCVYGQDLWIFYRSDGSFEAGVGVVEGTTPAAAGLDWLRRVVGGSIVATIDDGRVTHLKFERVAEDMLVEIEEG